MASLASVRSRLAPWLRPLGYGAAAVGFTALGLLLLHLLFAQRLERQQRRQRVQQAGAMVLLAEVALDRYSPAELALLIGTPVVVGPRPPRAVSPSQPADGALRRQAETLRSDLCRKLSACPVVWPVTGATPRGPGRGAWVQLNSPLDTAWLFAPIPALRGWPPDPQLLSLAGAFGGLATLLLFLSLEVQRPLRQLETALAGVGLDPQPRPVPARGAGAVRQITARFNAMLVRLHQAGDERATLLAGVAHDLRGPLTRLRLRLAQEAPWSAEQRQRAECDLSALERIITQFLSFVGAEGNEQPLRVPLDALVAEAANAVERVELALEAMERQVQPIAISRAVANLLANAEAHGRPPLRLALRALPGEGFVITVADGGSGIPPTDWERAKQPFQRLDQARGGLGHSGLGLAIAERVAHAHGGRLTCRHGVGGFVVELTGQSLPLRSHLVTSPPAAVTVE